MSGLDGDALLPIIRAWKPHILVLLILGSTTPISNRSVLTEGISVSLQNLLQRLTLTSNTFYWHGVFPSSSLTKI